MTETTTAVRRLSPVSFEATAAETEERGGWTVVLRYEDEGDGPCLVDLSHQARWDVQDGRLDGIQPGGVGIPQVPGRCALQSGLLINRMNRTQASVWHLKSGASPDMPSEPAYTDVTEATVFLALFGPHTFRVAEKLSALDFLGGDAPVPFLLQGPFSHVPCQIVVLERGETDAGGILLTCSRGYGRSMVGAVRAAGAEFGLQPAGERRFSAWLGALRVLPS